MQEKWCLQCPHCTIVHASLQDPKTKSNTPLSFQIGKHLFKAGKNSNGARKALCTSLMLHLPKDPKIKSKRLPPLSLQIWKHLFQSRKKGNDAAKLPAHDLPTIMCTAHTGSPKQGPRAVGRVQLNVHANFHGCLKQEKRKRSSQSSLRMHCVHKIPKPRPSSCWPHPINVNFHSCVRQETQ